MSFYSFMTPLFVVASSLLFALFSNQVTTPFMDEIFHVPQAQKYCQLIFEDYDPMITTFPGLYLFALAYERVLSFVQYSLYLLRVVSEDHYTSFDCDSLPFLRSLNLLFGIGNYVGLSLIMAHHHPINKRASTGEANRLLDQVNATLTAVFPVLYFFNFLFYTDSGSIFFVLCMYYASVVRGTHLLGAMCGACSVLMRQNNWIWTAFVLTVVLLEDYHTRWLGVHHHGDRRRSYVSLEYILKFVWSCITRAPELLIAKQLWGYVLLLLMFPVFLVINQGSAVLGDKQAHKTVLHLSQLVYYFAFVGVFWSPSITLRHLFYAFDQIRCDQEHHRRRNALARTTIRFVLEFVFFWVCINHFRYEHPYLMADNRHYVFYIYRRLVLELSPLSTSFLLPLLASIGFEITTVSFTSAPASSLEPMHQLLRYFLALFTAIVIVPTPLFEFRYFVIPFLFTRVLLHLSSSPPPPPLSSTTSLVSTWCILFIEGVVYLVMNSFTFYLFLFKPFLWPNGEEARFMW
eukprot:TRINITY_DN12406_c0_g1_i1.p1 TRINITY_DN12406_c0_g1~~TRINITY_DN12406_c0_g1_i1.p1  ORF type:complete len:517 (-),score=65.02 TRINITY_DN12406_c0_g1_i1:16-1566(-)